MRKLAATAMLMASLVALGACSSDDKKSSASAGSGTGSSTSSSSSSKGVPTGGGGDFCNTLKADVAIFDKLNESDKEPDLEQILGAVEDLAGKAPGEIKDDMNKLVEGFKKTIEFSSKASADPANAEALASSFEAENGDLEAASQHLEEFAKSECGIDLNSDSSDSST